MQLTPRWAAILSKAAVAAPTFDPASLFASGEKGLFYDFQNTATLFSDTGLTTPAATSIAGVKDLSPNGNNATQSTGSRQPSISSFSGYAAALFDGLDDGWVTGSIDFSGGDKLSVFAVTRKTNDTANGMVAEISATVSSNNGSAYIANLSTGSNWNAFLRGTGNSDIKISQAAPDTAVLTALFDIAQSSGSEVVFRRNGSAGGVAAGDAGSGNFGNYPVYIGRRGGSTLPYPGYLVALLVIGRLLTATEITNLEKWGAAKCGVTLP